MTPYELSRKEIIIRIRLLLVQGYSNRAISRQLGVGRKTVQRYAEIDDDPDILCRSRCSGKQSIEAIWTDSRDYIINNLNAGVEKKKIYKQLVAAGHSGGTTGFYIYCKSLCEEMNILYKRDLNAMGIPIDENKSASCKKKYVKRQAVLDYIWTGTGLTKEEWVYISNKYPKLHYLKSTVREFCTVFEKGSIAWLDIFLHNCSEAPIKQLHSFSKSLQRDYEAVANAVSMPYSNGFIEGNNNRLKMIKRTMYGRANFPLLRAKIIL